MLSRARRLASRVARRLGYTPPLRLRFTTAEDFTRFIDDPRAARPFSRLDLTVDPWFAPRPDWSGRVGPLPSVRSTQTTFDPTARRARVVIELTEAKQGADLVRAAHAAVAPQRATTGFGGHRVGVRPGAPADQRREPGGGLRTLLPKKPKRRKFTEYEIRIDAAGEHWLGDLNGSVRLLERPAAPPVLIDPKIHRPVDRRQPRYDTLSTAAAITGDRLMVRHGDQVLLDTPAREPITATGLRGLALVTEIDLSAVGTGPDASARVAELAAYGAVLHDAAPGLAVDPTLATLVSAPYTRQPLLDHVNRSLCQVRAVMRGHTRILTTRPWPSVSVLLSCRRPNLLTQILTQLAAQDIPQLEVVLGCHGFPAPSRDSFAPELRPLLGPILEFGEDVLFGDVLAALSAAASGDLLSKVDDDDLYGPQHLSDLVVAWHYADAQLVGRKLALVHYQDEDQLMVRRFFLEGYRWDAAGGASIIARGDLAAVGGWRSQRRSVDHGLMTRVWEAGGLVYTCSGPGYVHVRHSEGHTYDVADTRFKELYVEEALTGVPPAAYGLLDLSSLGAPAQPVR